MFLDLPASNPTWSSNCFFCMRCHRERERVRKSERFRERDLSTNDSWHTASVFPRVFHGGSLMRQFWRFWILLLATLSRLSAGSVRSGSFAARAHDPTLLFHFSTKSWHFSGCSLLSRPLLHAKRRIFERNALFSGILYGKQGGRHMYNRVNTCLNDQMPPYAPVFVLDLLVSFWESVLSFPLSVLVYGFSFARTRNTYSNRIWMTVHIIELFRGKS